MLSLGYGVVAYALSQLLVAVLFIVVYSLIGCQLVDLRGVKGVILKNDIKDIVQKGLGYMTTPVWQSIFFQGSTFVVRIALGAEAVAVFNTVRTVCRSVNQVFSIINASIFPDLQYEYGKGNLPLVQKYFRMAVLLSMVVGLLGTICLIVCGLDLYEWWTRSALSVPYEVWAVFMVGVLLNAVWWTSVVTYRMTNKPYHFAIASTITSILSVGVTYLFSLQFGLIGAAIGCTFFELVMAIYVLPDSCRNLQMRASDLFCNIKADANAIVSKVLGTLRH